MTNSNSRRTFTIGAADVLGFHLTHSLLRLRHHVAGYDGLTDDYDVTPKEQRLDSLCKYARFKFTKAILERADELTVAATSFGLNVTVHVAAQAGIRYSLENPRAYIDSNIAGLIYPVPVLPRSTVGILQNDSFSPWAPYRVDSIGHSQKIRLVDSEEAIGTEPGKKANPNDMSIKVGGLPSPRTDARLLDRLTDCRPQIPLQKRSARIASWYRNCYWK